MAVSMYQASVPAFVQMLSSLAAILDKAEAYAAERKIDPAVLLGWRLAPDMFALARQVQIATDQAKGCCARLAGVEVPKYADEETTFADLRGVSPGPSTSSGASSRATSTARRTAASRSPPAAASCTSRVISTS